jgi:hypothetical protein
MPFGTGTGNGLRRLETFAEHSILLKFKEGENFTTGILMSISRIEI